jgi:hypothetical protein
MTRTPVTRTTPTTTLIVSRPTDFRALEARYKLVRYELPMDLQWMAKKNRTIYGQMHNSLRDQLDCPYKIFTHDRRDGAEVDKWVVYALYRHNETPTTINISFLPHAPVHASPITFDSLDLHLLLKLLQIAYVLGEQTRRFIGQDLCYVHAKKEGNAHTCLLIDIKGDIRTEREDSEQEFKVTGQARRFQRVDYPDGASLPYAYFERKITDGTVYFLHLKRREIEKNRETGEPLYGIRAQEGKRTTLFYHDQRNIEESVGKLLYDFIHDFTAYLADYGITSRLKERHFFEFLPSRGQSHLPLSLLNPIAVFENRLAAVRPLPDYFEVFAQWMPDLHFKAVTDLSQIPTGAALVIQDYNKEDFEPGGLLAAEHREDPYVKLYRTYPQLSKQSINVNTNKSADSTAAAYLDYPALEPGNKIFKLKLEVSLSQLYLKDVIRHERSVQERLPLAPTDFVFIRKDRYFPYQPPYETLLFFENDRLRFLDLRDPIQGQQREELLARLGVDWEARYEEMLHKYRKRGEHDEDRELTNYDVIVGPGLFVELEDLNERVLYDYDTIVERQDAVKMALPIEALKLLAFYDIIRNDPHLSLRDLHERGLLEEQAHPKPGREAESLKFYRQLEEYDAYLDELQQFYPEISFNELWQGERMEQIIRIFDIHPDKHGKYRNTQFKSYYQKKRGWFSSDKAKDVHMYEGIWYDNHNCYMVGSSQSLKDHQPRAHLIRHFHIYQGHDHFDIQPLLRSTSVQFVRFNQYTVYPYAFHLLDLYVESVLRFR